jgi:hypothetical protein
VAKFCQSKVCTPLDTTHTSMQLMHAISFSLLTTFVMQGMYGWAVMSLQACSKLRWRRMTHRTCSCMIWETDYPFDLELLMVL